MTTDPILLALPIFFGSIIVEAICARRLKPDAYDLADAVTSLNFGTLSQVVGAATKLASFGIYAAIWRHAALWHWPQHGILAWAAALLFYDFLYYWLHRAGHEVALLWAAHSVHHSSEYYNLTTALRQTSTGDLLSWIFYLPMALAGIPPVMFITVGLIDLLYQYWVHTELIGRCGPLEYILVTPSNHRVHHGQNDYCIDRNYGGILILWDRLFGTFTDERADEKIIYGVRHALRSYNPLWGNLNVYRELLAQSREAPTLAAKIGVWLAPPGGWRTGPVAHFEPASFTRFSPGAPPRLQYYVAAQYALVATAVSWFLAGAPGLPAGGRLGLAAAVIIAMPCQAGLLHARRWAVRAEAARQIAQLLIAGGLAALAPSWPVPVSPLPAWPVHAWPVPSWPVTAWPVPAILAGAAACSLAGLAWAARPLSARRLAAG